MTQPVILHFSLRGINRGEAQPEVVMKAVRFVARFERSGWNQGPDVPDALGETREQALAAFLKEAATRVCYDAVLPGDIVVPVEFAESIPDRMPDYYGLLILEISSTGGPEVWWDWAAVPLGKFRLLNAFDHYHGRIQVVAEHVASGKPVVQSVVDENNDATVLRLPDRCLKFRNGAWVPCRTIGADWGDEPIEADAAT